MALSFLSSKQLQSADFLVKSSFGISIIAFLVVLPFTLINFFQGKFFIAFVCAMVLALCVYSAYSCYRGKYLLWLNLLAIVPSISLANLYTFYNMGVAGAFWCFMVIFTMYFVLPSFYAKLSNAIFLGIAVSIAWLVLPPDVYIRFAGALLGSSFFILVAVREIFRQQDKLKEQAVTDPLTGLLNRKSLEESLQFAMKLHEQKKQPACICLLDIDHFKKVNDTYGHDVGDKVVIGLAETIQNAMSAKDSIFRIGGEEFLILMNKTDENEGVKTASALIALVESAQIIEEQTITISAGLSVINNEMSWKEWVKSADDKLYMAKNQGRNQVVS